ASALGSAVQFTAPLSPIARATIQPAIPLRLIGMDSRSGYSDAGKGFWPFGISTRPIDIVRASLVMERHPKLEYLSTGKPAAAKRPPWRFVWTGLLPRRATAASSASY